MAIKFPDILEHNNSNNPLFEISQARGTVVTLNTLSDTGSIPNAKRAPGTIVFVTGSNEYYGYFGDTKDVWDTTSNWIKLVNESGLTSVSESIATDISSSDARLDTLEGKSLVSSSIQIDHDSTTGFVIYEHIDHSAVSMSAGTGLTGGGDLTTSRTLNVSYGNTAGTAVEGNTSLTIEGSENEIEVTGGSVTLGDGGTVTVGLPSDVTITGNLIVDTDTLYVTTNNRVGINKTNPSTELDVSGSITSNNIRASVYTYGDLTSADLKATFVTEQITFQSGSGLDRYDIKFPQISGSSGDEQFRGVLEIEWLAAGGSVNHQGKLVKRFYIDIRPENDILEFFENISEYPDVFSIDDRVSRTIQIGTPYLQELSPINYYLTIPVDWNGGGLRKGRFLITVQENNLDFYVNNYELSGSFVGNDANTMPTQYRSFYDRVGIGTNSPSKTLTVAGDISGSGLIYAPNIGTGVDDSVVILTTDGTLKTDEIDSRVWGNTLVSGSGTTGQVSYWIGGDRISGEPNLFWDADGDKLGIGTNSPTYTLDVAGNAGFNEYLYHNDDANTYIKFEDDKITLTAGGEDLITLTENGTQDIVKLGDGDLVDINLNDDLLVQGSSGNVGIGTNTPSKTLTIEGDISSSGIVYLENGEDKYLTTNTFAPDFGGFGARLETGISGSDDITAKLTLDELVVRKRLSVYELLINQIRATNGSLFVSSVGRIYSASFDGDDIYSLFFDTGSAGSRFAHGFQVNDLILAQRIDPTITEGSNINNDGTGRPIEVIHRSEMKVTQYLSSGSLKAELLNDTTPPEEGFDYVRLGNTDESDRQGTVYLTADDENAPYIDVVDGVTSHDDWFDKSKLKVRMGKLDGITDSISSFGELSGYGFWASGSAYLEGGINATFGEIGGFGITQTAISSSNNNLILRSTGQITGSQVLFTGGKISGSNLSIDVQTLVAKGDTVEISGSNFHLLNGNVTASNVDLSGKITSTTGKIGGFEITQNSITSSNNNLILRSTGQITGSNVLFTGGKISGSTLSIDVQDLIAKGNNIELNSVDGLIYVGEGSNFEFGEGFYANSTGSLRVGDGKNNYIKFVNVDNENLLENSQDFLNTDYWTTISGSVVESPSNVPSPSGEKSYTFKENNEDSIHVLRSKLFSIESGQDYTYSIFVKKRNTFRSRVQVLLASIGSFTPSAQAFFDLNNGTVVNGNANPRIIPYPDGWYRCVISSTSNTSTNVRAWVRMVSGSTLTTSYQGDGNLGVRVWGAQVEKGTEATPYLRTLDQALTIPSGSLEINVKDFTAIGDTVEISGSNFHLLNGNITASNVDLSGKIDAEEGKIGGFEITQNSITSSNNDLVLKSAGEITGSQVLFTGGKISGSNLSIDVTNLTAKGNSVEISGSNFHLLNGNVTASNVDLSGKITATTGKIGGFEITENSITSSNDNLILRSTGEITGSQVLFTGGKISGDTFSIAVKNVDIKSDRLLIRSGDETPIDRIALGEHPSYPQNGPEDLSLNTGKGFFANESGSVRIGDSAGKFFKFDADNGNISINANNFTLTPNGNFTATSAILTGSITANSGEIAGDLTIKGDEGSISVSENVIIDPDLEVENLVVETIAGSNKVFENLNDLSLDFDDSDPTNPTKEGQAYSNKHTLENSDLPVEVDFGVLNATTDSIPGNLSGDITTIVQSSNFENPGEDDSNWTDRRSFKYNISSTGENSYSKKELVSTEGDKHIRLKQKYNFNFIANTDTDTFDFTIKYKFTDSELDNSENPTSKQYSPKTLIRQDGIYVRVSPTSVNRLIGEESIKLDQILPNTPNPPTITPDGGNFTSDLEVSITAESENINILYYVGTDESANPDTTYDVPFTISTSNLENNTTIYVKATTNFQGNTEVSTPTLATFVYTTNNLKVTYSEGWNLVSSPFSQEKSLEFFIKDVFDENVTGHQSSSPSIFYFDGIYQLAESIEPGVGYWVNLTEETEVDWSYFRFQLATDEISNISIESEGWVLHGALGVKSTIAGDVGATLNAETTYGFNGSIIPVEADELEPGKAYWSNFDITGDNKSYKLSPTS